LENLSFLLGRSPGREFLKKLEETALSVPGVLGVQDPRAEYVGQDTVRVGMHIKVKPGIPIEEAHSISEAVHHRVKEVMGCRYCLVHVDPWKGEAESPEQN
jgi:divalent metal cation (Fe/Co/Zn/Cd) transporter